MITGDETTDDPNCRADTDLQDELTNARGQKHLKTPLKKRNTYKKYKKNFQNNI